MILERLTKIELNIDEQRRITLDYLLNRYEKNLKTLNGAKFENTRYSRIIKKELAALDAVIKILEQEI